MNRELQIRTFLEELLSVDERTRTHESMITTFADANCSDSDISVLHEIMNTPSNISYYAFFCLATIYRHNKDYSKLLKIIKDAEGNPDFRRHESLKHIRIMYETHSESLYDYDELLKLAHESACELDSNSGYQHTFANAFATICENCLQEDVGAIVNAWYDSALFCVNRAIELEPQYAKFYSTKARIVVLKNRFEEAKALILKAIDLEDSRKKEYYAIRLGNYQYYRAMIAIKKQQWLTQNSRKGEQQIKNAAESEKLRPFKELHPYAFVSYSHADVKTMQHIAKKLQEHNVNLWFDAHMSGGCEWDEAIGNKILNCEVVLLLLSPTAIASRNVRNEINMAQNHRKRIIPIFIEDCELTPGAELQLQGYNAYYAFQMSEQQLYARLIDDLSCTMESEGIIESNCDAQAETVKDGCRLPVITIIEQKCEGKQFDKQKCEDILVTTDQYIAVIDGATSKNGQTLNGKTGGRLTAEFIEKYLRENKMPQNVDGRTAICMMQAAIRNYATQESLEEKGIHLCASVVIYSIARKQIWSVGDCQFMINGRRYSFAKKIDEILSQSRSLAIQTLLNAGLTEEDLIQNDKARELILDEMKLQQYLENTTGEYGYSVFSSKGMIQDMSLLDVPPNSEVILASDGYPDLCSTLEESETRLQQLLKVDPLCYKLYKSTKGLTAGNQCFDDRTYIRFLVN